MMSNARMPQSCLMVVVALAMSLCAGGCAGGGTAGALYGEQSWSTAEPWSGPASETPTLFPVREDGKWGLIDRTGRLVVDYQYDELGPFSDGMAPVRAGVKWGYVDDTGAVAIAPQYSYVEPFSCGLAHVGNVSNYGATDEARCIDKEGNTVFHDEWYDTFRFSEGLAGVRVLNDDNTESRGYIDTAGELVIWLPGDEYCGQFSEGLAGVDGGYINRDAQLVIKGGFIHPTAFSDGLAVVKTVPGYAIIDRTGSVVANLDYEQVGALSDGMAAVRSKDGWGYMDASGALAIPIQFYDALDFSGGLARVTEMNGKMAYIDVDGNYVWQEK